MLRVAIFLALAAFLSAAAPLGQAQAQGNEEFDALYRQVVELRRAKRFTEALAVAERSLALAEQQHGANHPQTARALSSIGGIYMFQGRFAEAEPHLARALAIVESTLGPRHPWAGTAHFDLAGAYHAQGRLAQAETSYKRSLAIREGLPAGSDAAVGQVAHTLGTLFLTQGRFAEAAPLLERALAIAERQYGLTHQDVGPILNSLAQVYVGLHRSTEAEVFVGRALAVVEKTFGPEHRVVGINLKLQGEVLIAQNRFTEAEPVLTRALKIIERSFGPKDLLAASLLNSLAETYKGQTRYAEAEPIYQRALVIREQTLGAGHPDVAESLNGLALLYLTQARYSDAELLLQRVLAINEKAFGEKNPIVATILSNLGTVYEHEARYVEAERLFRRSLAIREAVLAPDDRDVGVSLGNLATLYRIQGRLTEALPLYERVVSILTKARGPEHPDVGVALGELAEIARVAGRLADAEALNKRALAIFEKAYPDGNPQVATTGIALAEVYKPLRRYEEAETLTKRALEIWEKVFSPEHPYVASGINNLGHLYAIQGRHAEAEVLYRRALAINEKFLGKDHNVIGVAFNNIAAIRFAQQDWDQAVNYWTLSTDLAIRRSRREGPSLGDALVGNVRTDIDQESLQFKRLISATYRLAAVRPDVDDQSRKMFKIAQWAQTSEAARSLAQMGARQAKDRGSLALTTRERQDLVAEWHVRDKQLMTTRARGASITAEALGRLGAIDARIREIDASLRDKFPEYVSLANPEPLTVEEVQALLRPDEALVLFLDSGRPPTPAETFIWVVSQTEVRWARTELGTYELWREVAALRCGLDLFAAWAASDCKGLLGKDYTVANYLSDVPLPFDLDRAHRLYRALFGQVSDLIAGKQLLLVPSGPLTMLPFHVLVTKAPESPAADTAAMRNAQWLALVHATWVLPSVATLRTLRRNANLSRAARPYFGIANPLLNGPDDRYVQQAEQARRKQSCESLPRAPAAPTSPPVEGGQAPSAAQIAAAGDVIDPEVVRQATPVPETADLICAVAKDLKAGPEDVRLGARATEADLKSMSEQGTLASYRIIHIATHGAVAGTINAHAEPGLILSPPSKGTMRDDGYLSASEVASLRLDADWVILSACYTAAPGAESAEALSGLASAFFYAGARALLVSHWAVEAQTTVELVTKMMSALAKDPMLGRAEALRKAMLSLIKTGQARQAHPALWAPFIVVGEGAIPRM